MKKIIISFFLLAIASSAAMAQEKHTFIGTYNGKKIKIVAYHSKPEDDIKLIDYEPLNNVEKLKTSLSSLQTQYQNIVSERDQLQQKLNRKCSDSTLVKQLRRANRQIDSINSEMNRLRETVNNQLASIALLQDSIAKLSHSHLDGDTIRVLNEKLEQYRKDLNVCQQKLDSCSSFIVLKNRNLVSAEVFFGATHLYNNLTSQSFWSRALTGSQKYHITTTLFFSEDSPWALKVGMGVSRYQSQISCNIIKDSVFNQQDIDGDIYDSWYEFNNVSEKVSLTYLDLPIMIHIGNTYSDLGLQAWADFGFTLGLNVSKKFYGSGTYSAEFYYPDWNVTINDVPELGSVSNANIYSTVNTIDVSRFVLWANAAIGMYIPINNHIGVNIGAHLDYSLTPLATNENYDGRVVIGGANTLSGSATRSISSGLNLGLSINF